MVTWSKTVHKHFPQLAERSLDQYETFRFIWQFMSGRRRNKYSLTLKVFNCILQSYYSSLSYIIRWFDFQVNSLQIVQMLTEVVLQHSTLMLSSRRNHFIDADVSENIYWCLCGFSLDTFFQIINFLHRFRQCFKHFYIFEK